jgi:hypothetical protein
LPHRFVEQIKASLADEGASKAGALLLAAGNGRWIFVQDIGDFKHLRHRLDLLV